MPKNIPVFLIRSSKLDGSIFSIQESVIEKETEKSYIVSGFKFSKKTLLVRDSKYLNYYDFSIKFKLTKKDLKNFKKYKLRKKVESFINGIYRLNYNEKKKLYKFYKKEIHGNSRNIS